MNKQIFFLIAFVTLGLANGQSPTFQWAKSMGGTGDDQGNSIAVDASGNVYTTGWFTGTVDFDPGVGTFNLTSAGAWDIFISKLDASGKFIWAKRIGGLKDDGGQSIGLDPSGNIYITGYFGGTADFDSGAGTYTLSSAGYYDIFILKFDPLGSFLWARNLGGSGIDIGNAVTTDAAGNVYTTGMYGFTADFDPGPDTFNLSGTAGIQIFVSKLNAFGDFVWAKNFPGSSYQFGNSIALDASGNVYTTGPFQDSADFDPGAGTFILTTTGVNDVFISKLDVDGNFVWAKKMGGHNNDYGHDIKVDPLGNVYLNGTFSDTADFNPGAGTYNLISSGWFDTFISKLDALGNFVWAKRVGGPVNDIPQAIAIDINGNVYTSGEFSGTGDFDAGVAVHNLTASGMADIFFLKLDASGNFVWAKNIGGVFDDSGRGITVDASGNVYSTGSYSAIADFDPGPATFTLTCNDGGDIFIHKMSQNGFVGIEENEDQNNIRIYPNPTNSNFTCETESTTEIIIFNHLGSIIFEEVLPAGKNKIDLSHFSNGIYIVRSVSDKNIKTTKLVKVQ